MKVNVERIERNSLQLNRLISLSREWEKENSCFGYCANGEEDFAGKDIFAAYCEDEIIGYLFGYCKELDEKITPLEKGTKCFELDEIFVKKEFRSKGVGKALFDYAQEYCKGRVDCITLSTAAKNHKSILHFYIENAGMTFWSARLFKRI